MTVVISFPTTVAIANQIRALPWFTKALRQGKTPFQCNVTPMIKQLPGVQALKSPREYLTFMSTRAKAV